MGDRLESDLTMPARIVVSQAGAVLAVVGIAFSCSWDSPIWPKDARSTIALFRFEVDGKAGYIDRRGKVVIPPKFPVSRNDGFDDFFEGVAQMVGYWPSTRLIDMRGDDFPLEEGLIPRGHFSQGFLPAEVSGGNPRLIGYANRQRRLQIRAQFDGAAEFSEGLAAVSMNGKWGYIDRSGEMAVPPWFLRGESFSENAARVVADGPCVYTGYGPCEAFNPVVLGAALKRRFNLDRYPPCRYTFIDRRGGRLFPQTWRDALDFSEGLAAVGDGYRWGYIDRTGALKIALRFESAGSFHEGLARVQVGRGWGFVDRKGDLVIRPQFVWAGDFSDGAALVGEQYERVWFIDRAGNVLFGRGFSRASEFRLGLAHVFDGQKYEYIDREGRTVFTYHKRAVR